MRDITEELEGKGGWDIPWKHSVLFVGKGGRISIPLGTEIGCLKEGEQEREQMGPKRSWDRGRQTSQTGGTLGRARKGPASHVRRSHGHLVSEAGQCHC